MARFGRRPFDVARREEDDPLDKAMAPPPNETPEEREKRLADEAEAQRRSDAIDEEINKQRLAEKREPHIRILLLGQSESGKSTTLKNFQLMNSPKAFRNERASWRAVVQLNVVRSIRTILGVMSEASGRSTPMTISRPGSPEPDADSSPLSPELLKLKMRLAPLQQVEEALLRKLSPPGSMDFEATHLAPVTNLPYATRSSRFTREVAVHSNSQWKGAFSRFMASVRTSLDSMDVDFASDPNDPGVVLNACIEDMIKLWTDPTIQSLLKTYKVRLEDKAGFFLDSLHRVASLNYVPTDDDILRARLKTLGVSEHRFKFKAAGNMVSNDWRIYDVGGARYLRAAWVPYFDNMDAIIFLAPISAFDEVLVEDTSVNRLEDSVLLWKSTVSNKLLEKSQTVLFLNKIDLLRAKLEAGIEFGHYVVSYGDKPNEYDAVSAYLKKKFAGVHKQYSPVPRILYCHLTTMTDAKSTQNILANVIYQSIYKFVVLSSVTDDKWTVYMGLSDSEGRWWKGSWEDHDVHAILGSKASDKLIEEFADQLAKLFVEGELYISNWSTAPGTQIKLTLGPGAKRPMHISLEELSPSQAAEFATGIFLDIALQAKSRKCRLHGSSISFQSSSTSSVPLRAQEAKPTLQTCVSDSSKKPEPPIASSSRATSKAATAARTVETEPKADPAKKRATAPEKPAAPPAPRPQKGASLANPNKKARKYKAIEFESDSE
ncbi:hypothetical protein EST38_g4531 [Candolleomyces aberdarensis]|uniref:Guanine nucleotide-binding protein alpha-4 subunit n=1 Tax=Candolleomyces aberdarensis TaxID=2316362 RepID=A0A4Q2DMR5_9AGAR|nr:hypothetical protein EST38_g4531 [Candolleomyces aberdarensis]